MSTRGWWIRWAGTRDLSCPIKPGAEPSEDHDFSIVELPEIEQSVTTVHRRSMFNVLRIIRTLARWIDAIRRRSAD